MSELTANEWYEADEVTQALRYLEDRGLIASADECLRELEKSREYNHLRVLRERIKADNAAYEKEDVFEQLGIGSLFYPNNAEYKNHHEQN